MFLDLHGGFFVEAAEAAGVFGEAGELNFHLVESLRI